MSYIFKNNIDVQEYDNFIRKQHFVSFMQESAWANVKDNWKSYHVGLYQDNTLVAVSLFLIKHLAKGIYLGYIPRGYIIDYQNIEMLKAFTEGIKELARQEHCYTIKLDPNFCFHETSILEAKKKEPITIPLTFSISHNQYHKNLLMLHYKHKGYPKEISKTLQPRFHMMVPLVHEDFTPLTKEEFFKSFKRKIRDQLGNFHIKRGVFFEHTTEEKYLDEFMEVLKSTEQRQDIHLRNKAYFKKIMDHYQERAVLFFGKVDLKIYLEFLKTNQGKETEINEIEAFIKEGKKTITLSTALVIMPQNEKIRVSEYLYAGNVLLLSKLQVSLGLVFDICNYSIEHNCTYCNLGGVDGNLNDHLSTFKSKFNPIVMEFAGEYDLPLKKILYYSIELALSILKKIHLK